MRPHDFAYPRVKWKPWPHGEPSVTELVAPDREMRCCDCSVRVFSSRAGELVASGYACPHCATPDGARPGHRAVSVSVALPLPPTRQRDVGPIRPSATA